MTGRTRVTHVARVTRTRVFGLGCPFYLKKLVIWTDFWPRDPPARILFFFLLRKGSKAFISCLRLLGFISVEGEIWEACVGVLMSTFPTMVGIYYTAAAPSTLV